MATSATVKFVKGTLYKLINDMFLETSSKGIGYIGKTQKLDAGTVLELLGEQSMSLGPNLLYSYLAFWCPTKALYVTTSLYENNFKKISPC